MSKKTFGSVSNYGQRNTGQYGGHSHNPGLKTQEKECENCGQLLKRVRVLSASSREKIYKYVNLDGKPHICKEKADANT